MERKSFEQSLRQVVADDVEGLIEAKREYGDSWRSRGGQGAYFTLVRPLDRLGVVVAKNHAGAPPYDIFAHCLDNPVRGQEGLTLNAVRDLRRYLLLVEAYLVEEGHELPLQRHNQQARARDTER